MANGSGQQGAQAFAYELGTAIRQQLGASGMEQLGLELAQRFARRATLRTQFSPPITFEPFAKTSSSSSAPAPATSSSSWNPLKWIKPSLQVEGDFGTFNLETKYGPPSESYVPHAAGLGSGLAAVVFWLAGKDELAKVAAAAALGFVVVGEMERRS